MKNRDVRLDLRKVFLVLAMAAISVAIVRPASATGRIQGKVWVVSPTQAGDVVFPAPTSTPDATFSTNGITYIGQFINTTNPATHCFTITRFLGGCPTPVFKLVYSKLPNTYLGGAAAGPTTAMGGTDYGVIIEFTGTVNLTNGQEITIFHDDGVSLMIDGIPVSGFGTGVNVPLLESVTFTGTTGPHSIDLLYGNVGGVGNGAWLLFFPALF
ncbi:MAG TPA: hypothetical protein VJX69_15090 [Terriglobales bacterium]|nr:hypothetical protein [Terriglobales bacterium]